MHKILLTALAAGLSAGIVSTTCAQDGGMASMHDQRREGGRLCMSDHSHSGNGMGKTKPAARVAALRAWASFTAFEYGSAWASYAASGSQSTRYVKEASGWTAIVEGRPCRR